MIYPHARNAPLFFFQDGECLAHDRVSMYYKLSGVRTLMVASVLVKSLSTVSSIA